MTVTVVNETYQGRVLETNNHRIQEQPISQINLQYLALPVKNLPAFSPEINIKQRDKALQSTNKIWLAVFGGNVGGKMLLR